MQLCCTDMLYTQHVVHTTWWIYTWTTLAASSFSDFRGVFSIWQIGCLSSFYMKLSGFTKVLRRQELHGFKHIILCGGMGWMSDIEWICTRMLARPQWYDHIYIALIIIPQFNSIFHVTVLLWIIVIIMIRFQWRINLGSSLRHFQSGTNCFGTVTETDPIPTENWSLFTRRTDPVQCPHAELILSSTQNWSLFHAELILSTHRTDSVHTQNWFCPHAEILSTRRTDPVHTQNWSCLHSELVLFTCRMCPVHTQN